MLRQPDNSLYIRGEDYDFKARKGDLSVNVEVTALEDKDFYKNTLRNSLEQKRKQLPKGEPAIIFCAIPWQWSTEIPYIESWMTHVVHRFLAKTETINYVVIESDMLFDVNSEGTKGGMGLITKQFANQSPKHSCDLSALFADFQSREAVAALVSEAFDNEQKIAEFSRRSQMGSEFSQWVEHLAREETGDDGRG